MSGVRAASTSVLRPLGVLLSAVCVAAALHLVPPLTIPTGDAWLLVAAAGLLAVLWQCSLRLRGTAVETPPLAAERARALAGTLIVLGGASLWIWAVRAMYLNWAASFDHTWIAWLTATVALSVGFDLLWGRWPQPAASNRLRSIYLPLLILTAVAAAYRLGNITHFPGEGAQTQIEDVMTGLWGQLYLSGSRVRWEYLSWSWLAALGIALGGPTLTAMRVPFAVVSTLKTIPIFLWLRLAVGPAGALVGTALFAVSSWDIVLSRIPNNHNGLIVAVVFALLAGPARRGRPSVYVWLGFLSGYVLYEYVAYRPLAFFALFGATAISLRDRTVRWPARLARPAITLALLVSMVLPLFLNRLDGRIQTEYFDGFRRASLYSGYYDPQSTWEHSIRKRIDRALSTASLFFFVGDRSPVHNVNERPLIDPITATLLLFGMAYGIGHLSRGVVGLTLVAFVATLTGTLIVTGNFDIGRAGGAVPYLYALVGYGAASIVAACEASWRRAGRSLALGALALAVVAAGYLNTRFLLTFWSSPIVKRAMHSDLPYLSSWLRLHTRDDEQLVGITPGFDYVLGPNDAAWLRGKNIPGIAAWDIETALRYWEKHPANTLFAILDGPGTHSVKEYLEGVFPELHFEVDRDPLQGDSDIVYVHQQGPPASLADRLRDWRCQGIQGDYTVSSVTEQVLAHVTLTTPFIDASAWPTAVRTLTFGAEGTVRRFYVRFATTFAVQASGTYRFLLETASGSAQLLIDGAPRDQSGNGTVELDTNPHALEVIGTFEPGLIDPMVRLMWQGPDSQERRELMPFHRISVVDPACRTAAGQPH